MASAPQLNVSCLAKSWTDLLHTSLANSDYSIIEQLDFTDSIYKYTDYHLFGVMYAHAHTMYTRPQFRVRGPPGSKAIMLLFFSQKVLEEVKLNACICNCC